MANGMPSMNSAGMGELFARLRFVLIALLIYRIGTHIPVPGIDPEQLASLFDQNQGTILGLANVFSGGALERMSILALGILPYISASIIMQLMTAVTPQLEQLKKEGEAGRRKISQWTRYLTVVLALVQGSGMTVGLANQGLTYATGLSFYVTAVASLVRLPLASWMSSFVRNANRFSARCFVNAHRGDAIMPRPSGGGSLVTFHHAPGMPCDQ